MEIKELQNKFTPGTVRQIVLRPGRKEVVLNVKEVMAIEGRGLEGDRYNSKGGSRQVTIIQQESLAAIGSYLQRNVDPSMTRRNIVVSGINLVTLKGKRFRLGHALLEYSGECHPCSRMEENLGEGGYNAMRGHGGITAKIVESGLIRIGDALTTEPDQKISSQASLKPLDEHPEQKLPPTFKFS